jgi:hypothetical protein
VIASIIKKVLLCQKKAIVSVVGVTMIIILIPVLSNSRGDDLDMFGIREIYPTKAGEAKEWYFNSDHPLADRQFTLTPETSKITKNLDGSWHINRKNVPVNEGARINVLSYNNSSWKDVEMTGYVKLTSYSHSQGFSWRVRSGTPHVETCKGTSYYLSLRYDGRTADISKELWHGENGLGYAKPRGVVHNITSPLLDRWVGIKAVVYNIDHENAVKLELWIDENADNHWRKLTEVIDNGGWAARGLPKDNDCINPLSGKPRAIDDIILWGGTQVTYRADDSSFDFKNLSIREIENPG